MSADATLWIGIDTGRAFTDIVCCTIFRFDARNQSVVDNVCRGNQSWRDNVGVTPLRVPRDAWVGRRRPGVRSAFV